MIKFGNHLYMNEYQHSEIIENMNNKFERFINLDVSLGNNRMTNVTIENNWEPVNVKKGVVYRFTIVPNDLDSYLD